MPAFRSVVSVLVRFVVRSFSDTCRSGAFAQHNGHRPCRARPADRSLVAEDRSARGVRDQTGPEPLMLVRGGSATDR